MKLLVCLEIFLILVRISSTRLISGDYTMCENIRIIKAYRQWLSFLSQNVQAEIKLILNCLHLNHNDNKRLTKFCWL